VFQLLHSKQIKAKASKLLACKYTASFKHVHCFIKEVFKKYWYYLMCSFCKINQKTVYLTNKLKNRRTMKLFFCAVAALTLSVSTMNAQEEADVINVSKTQVVKKADKIQLVEMKKVAKKENKSLKTEMREDAKDAKGNYAAPKKKELKKVTRKTDAELVKEKKAKQKNKSIDN
jgi:hypothetical protein